jgi:hypothetical protein
MGQLDPTAFAHYWEDFMLEQDEKRDEITLERRKCLRAIGQARSSEGPVLIADIESVAGKLDLDVQTARQVVDEFVSRELFTRSGEAITARVRLFERWLKERGQQQIVLAGVELQAASQLLERRERLRVSYDEAERLVGSWGTYQGKVISADRLLHYLKQFDSLEDQRLVFKILGALQFIDDASMNAMFKSAFSQITESLKVADGAWNKGQIRLSFFGDSGKSPLAMARAFASANGIMRDSRGIVPPEDLEPLISNGVKDVIFVDDFVGSGDTISHALTTLKAQVPDAARVHFVVLAGASEGLDRVDTALRDAFGDRAGLHAMYTTPDASTVFSQNSGIFDSADEAADALQLVRRQGELLESRTPLGYDDVCALITFSTTIPNNAPPMLRKSSTGRVNFEALFPRP